MEYDLHIIAISLLPVFWLNRLFYAMIKWLYTYILKIQKLFGHAKLLKTKLKKQNHFKLDKVHGLNTWTLEENRPSDTVN